MIVSIRNENKNEERIVEEITRKAFWNLYFPGCDEHYLAHLLRSSEDFVPELNMVILLDEKIIGSIMYTKSCVINENDKKIDTITFGPVSIDPQYHRKGYGSQLIKYSMKKAFEMGYRTVIIYGNPMNYCHLGFCGSKRYQIQNSEGRYPCGLLVNTEEKTKYENHTWKFYESKSYNIDNSKLDEFDQTFEKAEKEKKYLQEQFWILINAYLDN